MRKRTGSVFSVATFASMTSGIPRERSSPHVSGKIHNTHDTKRGFTIVCDMTGPKVPPSYPNLLKCERHQRRLLVVVSHVEESNFAAAEVGGNMSVDTEVLVAAWRSSAVRSWPSHKSWHPLWK
jgi:hypothetical protein